MSSDRKMPDSDHEGPVVGDDDIVLLRLTGDKYVDLVLNTSVSEFRGKIQPGETIALGRRIAEDLLQSEPDGWEIVVPKTKDRR